MKLGEPATHTWAAPMALSSVACSGLRTMFTSAMPSCWQMRFSICPRLEAAAVCTSALWPSRRIVSTMPSAVSGLTKDEAPSAGVAPSGKRKHCSAATHRYCEYMAPPSTATVLPSSACAAADAPASTTTPAPSLPTGMEASSRPAMPFMAASGTRAVITGRSAVPDKRAVLMSAAPNSSPRSDGLMGDASMRTSTSSGPGRGTGTLASDTSSSPLRWMSERSWRAVRSLLRVMGCLLFWPRRV